MKLTVERVREAEAYLSNADPVMAVLIDRHGPCPLAERVPDPPYHTLAASIISQQLSVKAADTILRRVVQLAPHPMQPDAVAALAPERLRAAGMSTRKAASVQQIAQRVLDGAFSFEALNALDDETAIARLVELPGVGRWTAQMFLLFGCLRPDILAPGDAGLQRAVRQLYGESVDLEGAGNAWRPYASVASWYLWRSLGG